MGAQVGASAFASFTMWPLAVKMTSVSLKLAMTVALRKESFVLTAS